MSGYFARRRQAKRLIVKYNTPLWDRIKDVAWRWFILISLVVVVILVLRGHNNGAW